MTSINEWAPLVIAIATLALATMRERPNYLAVIVAGIFFVFAAAQPVWDSENFARALALFGAYHALDGAIELMPDENGVETYGED